jgi:FG-GAP repeat
VTGGVLKFGDHFGNSLSSGDYNGDRHDDLAIGIPGQAFADIVNAGAMEVLHDSPFVLSAGSPI